MNIIFHLHLNHRSRDRQMSPTAQYTARSQERHGDATFIKRSKRRAYPRTHQLLRSTNKRSMGFKQSHGSGLPIDLSERNHGGKEGIITFLLVHKLMWVAWKPIWMYRFSSFRICNTWPCKWHNVPRLDQNGWCSDIFQKCILNNTCWSCP